MGLLDVYEARRRCRMREISDANKTQDFLIDEFARLSIEHHELARVFKNHREATKPKIKARSGYVLATMVSVSLCADEKLTAFIKLEKFARDARS